MFAKNLEICLAGLYDHADISRDVSEKFAERFESLRRYGRLPRGRENRAKRLSRTEIAAAILGCTALRPAWTGHTAICLSRLMPVGGAGASFFGAATLLEAVECLLQNPAASNSLVALRVSMAEGGVNSNGFATLVYDVDGERRRTAFVPELALSLLTPGVEREFDIEKRYAAASSETVLNQAFFHQIVREMARAETQPAHPAGDGSEYDAEEAEQVRRKKLGVLPGSRFLSVGVDNQVTWPREETLVEFDGCKLVLLPRTRDHITSIHIDLHASKKNSIEAMSLINRFLSLMTWCDDQFSIKMDGMSGSPVPGPVPKPNLAFTTAHHWIFDRKTPALEEGRRAIAIYREARNAEQNYLVGYAVLGYFKIIELRHKSRGDAKSWFRTNFEVLRKDRNLADRMARFLAACGAEQPHDHIYRACRTAVAHANKPYSSDPDDFAEIRRLHVAADILRALARRFVATELRISDCMFDGT